MPLSFDEQNAFNLGAAARANKGGKNPHSRATEREQHDAWQHGYSTEDKLLSAQNIERKPS